VRLSRGQSTPVFLSTPDHWSKQLAAGSSQARRADESSKPARVERSLTGRAQGESRTTVLQGRCLSGIGGRSVVCDYPSSIPNPILGEGAAHSINSSASTSPRRNLEAERLRGLTVEQGIGRRTTGLDANSNRIEIVVDVHQCSRCPLLVSVTIIGSVAKMESLHV
jgi:hypothetical protein